MFEPESFESYNHTSYTEFKKYIDGTYATLAFQYQEKTDYYIIVTEPYAGIAQSFDLIKNSGADQTDFETNFKNLPPRKPGSYQTTQVTGSIAAGASFSGNPVVFSGVDGSSNVRVVKTTSDGSIRIDPIGTTAQPIVGTGTAGTPNSGVVTIQGIVGGVAVPISGSITATNPSVNNVNTTPPTSLTYIGGNVSTSAPSYTNGNASAISLTTSGAIRVDNSGVTQPVSGTITANAGTGNFTVVQSTASNLNASVVGTGTAGTPAGGILSIQGVSGGQPVPISGSISATNPSVSTNNSSAPTSSTQIGGTDGTNLQAARVFDLDSGAGSQYILGVGLRKAASGGSVELGTNTDPVRTDPTGTTTQPISGTVTANAGTGVFDITPVSPVATDYLPVRLTNGTAFYSLNKENTYSAVGSAIVIGNNKSMLSITNATGSGVVIKIYEIYVVNAQTTAVTGVIGNFELRRIVSHSAGTLVTPEAMDLSATLNANVTLRTGSTVATESTTLMWVSRFSTDEWGAGTLDVEANDHSNQPFFPIWSTSDLLSPIVLRENQGLTVKFATNSTAGSFDILVKFTQA